MSTDRLEKLALEVGNSRTALRKRLQVARGVLIGHFNRQFGRGRFDFANKHLIGDNGLFLQWQTRYYPDQPESYRNQQTSRGVVSLARSPQP